MQIASIGPNINTINTKSSPNINNFNQSYSPNLFLGNDVFVSSAKNVSFGNSGGHTERTDNLKDGLLAIGMVGAPLLLAITAGTMAANSDIDPSNYFSSGDYPIDLTEKSVSFDGIIADADDGIFKVEGTPINLDASRFDYADVENGIYRNNNGSVDIDLLNGRYIDAQNGIFVDQNHKISAFIDSDGDARHFSLPVFGSGYPTNQWADSRWSTLQEAQPETGLGVFEMAGNKFKELFGNIFGSDDTEESNDLFGRSIIQNLDGSGGEYLSIQNGAIASPLGITTPTMAQFMESVNDQQFSRYLGQNAQFSDIADNLNNGNYEVNLVYDENGVMIGIDIDGDGRVDIAFIDTDDNGKFDSVDFNNDGVADGKLIDIDGDGKFDGIDFDGDGQIDYYF